MSKGIGGWVGGRPTDWDFGDGSDGDITISEDTSWSAQEYSLTNLTVDAEKTLTLCAGAAHVIRVIGNVTINGTIRVLGGVGNPKRSFYIRKTAKLTDGIWKITDINERNTLLPSSSTPDDVKYDVDEVGGAGGAGVQGTGSGTINGPNGNSGTAGTGQQTGGGGSGGSGAAVISGAGTTWLSGAGAAGTCNGGGSGGGGSGGIYTTNAPCGGVYASDAALYCGSGGHGGNGSTGTTGIGGGGGGAGNPGGSGGFEGASCTANQCDSGESIVGGTVLFVVKGDFTVSASAVISANGGKGGKENGGANIAGSGGGGSGGGAIVILHRGSYTNSGSITANGGAGGAGGSGAGGGGNTGGSGGAGGAGTITEATI